MNDPVMWKELLIFIIAHDIVSGLIDGWIKGWRRAKARRNGGGA